MKQTDGFVLREMNGIPYLLPYGQRIAEQRRGIKLNEAGVFLWNAIPHVHNRQELLERFSQHYDALPNEIPELNKDMNTFLDQLLAWGMITDSHTSPDAKPYYINIAGLNIKFLAPAEVIPDEFKPFAVSDCHEPDMTIEIKTSSGLITSSLEGTLLIHTDELLVCEQEKEYLIHFPMAGQIQDVQLAKDGRHAIFFCHPPYREPLLSDLFHAIRLVFLYLAQQKGMVVIHSASVYYQENAWLFSGSSGTGKSTHTNHWQQLFQTPIINGDLNLVAIENNEAVVHGIPWCGTSGIADPKTYPLGGIIHLKQADSNFCTLLSNDEKTLFIMQRTISPSWTTKMLDINLNIAKEIAQKATVTRLFCTKEPEAAYYMRTQIDTKHKNGDTHV